MLDVVRGAGVLVKPDPATNVHVEHEGQGGLHAADWNQMLERLAVDGWTLFADEWDLPIEMAHLADGRVALGLYPAHEDADALSDEQDLDFKLAVLDLLRQVA